MPLPHASGELAHGGYSFLLQFCTAGINSYDGNFMPYMVGDSAMQFTESEADAIVSYVKTTVKQEWSPNPIPHRLRRTWAHLPHHQWLLPDPTQP
eukprot:7383755-Prymnesium_polylepis.1